jgi:peptidyl-dipeptidase Dcp
MKQKVCCALPLLILFCCFDAHSQKQMKSIKAFSSNPFATESKLPFHAPPFNKIKDKDYKPAFEEGLKQQLQEINKVANNSAPATFQNTIVALEKSGQLLTRVNRVFNGVASANTDNILQKLQEEIAPKLSGIQDAMYLNPKLFSRVESVYNNRTKLKLDPESSRLLDVVDRNFILAGAKLSSSDKVKMKKLNEEEASLSANFTNRLVNAAKDGAIVIDNAAELAGLPQSDLDAYAQNAKAKGLTGKWLIPLKNTTQQPVLQSLTNRTTREKIFKASWMRAEKNDSNDTRGVISRIAEIRAQKAALMGFSNYASWRLVDQMAGSPQAVDQFFAQLVPAITAKAKKEATDIQAVIDQQRGGFKLQPWDWDFYANQVRKAKYNVEESEIKPYFELNNVLENGVFYAANQLYGLTFKERHDIPVYQPDVRVFEVFDKDRKSLALFYADYFKRDNKSGGAWMDNFVGQSKLLGTKPVIYNVGNFTKPAPGQPALISFDDVTTMFHEFGHALHGMFADQKYPTLSGTNTARDFVEFPSQFNEHWALDPKVLKHYALHYKTHQPIPLALLDKIKKAASFNTGYDMVEAVAAASLDLQWHKLAPKDAPRDVDAFEKTALHVTGLDLNEVPPRYRSSYFLHIWGNGYQAAYYAYQWTKMLEEDAYAWFEEHGGLTRANGERFRDMILSRGNTEDLNKMYKNFRGHAPDIRSLEKQLQLPTE